MNLTRRKEKFIEDAANTTEITLFEFDRQVWQNQVHIEKPQFKFKSKSQEPLKYKTTKTDEQTIEKFNKRFSNKLNGASKTNIHTRTERERASERDI